MTYDNANQQTLNVENEQVTLKLNLIYDKTDSQLEQDVVAMMAASSYLYDSW